MNPYIMGIISIFFMPFNFCFLILRIFFTSKSNNIVFDFFHTMTLRMDENYEIKDKK